MKGQDVVSLNYFFVEKYGKMMIWEERRDMEINLFFVWFNIKFIYFVGIESLICYFNLNQWQKLSYIISNAFPWIQK